jgi:hypothetical protein
MCRGQDSSTVHLKITPSGFASMELGEIVKGGFNKKTNSAMDNTWMKQIITGLSVNAALSARSSLTIGLQMQMYNDFPISLSLQPQYRYLYFYPYLSQAEFTHAFGNVENHYLTLGLGYFPLKYNGDARNLGEYLFRTGTYPQYIYNNFDFPLARLLGARGCFTPIKDLKIDAILSSNLQWYAVGDWNLAILASEKIGGFIELGAGVSLNSIISQDTKLTTPHDPATVYHITYNETTGKGDSSFYSFKGTKLMGRFSIDPKAIFLNDIFGKEDLKVYGEAAILGLQDYPRNLRGGISYDKILERIPVMAGFNIPSFKFFDVVGAEVEWFKCPYPNDVGAITQQGIPIPGQIGENGVANLRDSSIYAKDKWKWSVYATKTIARNYTATLQVASDHLRPLAVNDQNVDFEEALHYMNQWYYMLKLTAGF